MSALLSVASTWQQPDMLAIDSLSISLTVGSPDDAQSEAVSEEGSTEHTTGSDGSCDAIQPHSAAVHALNILRALYRDSRLGEHVTPFVPEGVEIAVRGFSASLWPVSSGSVLHTISHMHVCELTSCPAVLHVHVCIHVHTCIFHLNTVDVVFPGFLLAFDMGSFVLGSLVSEMGHHTSQDPSLKYFKCWYQDTTVVTMISGHY